MNLTLGSSCPIYHPLSMNRWPCPLTYLNGSVHSPPAIFLTVWYFLLQPLQSSSLTLFGLTLCTAARGVALVVAAPLGAGARLSWAMTAAPRAGTRSRRSDRRRRRDPRSAAPRRAE